MLNTNTPRATEYSIQTYIQYTAQHRPLLSPLLPRLGVSSTAIHTYIQYIARHRPLPSPRLPRLDVSSTARVMQSLPKSAEVELAAALCTAMLGLHAGTEDSNTVRLSGIARSRQGEDRRGYSATLSAQAHSRHGPRKQGQLFCGRWFREKPVVVCSLLLRRTRRCTSSRPWCPPTRRASRAHPGG